MGEEQDLGPIGQVAEYPEAGCCAFIVEVDEQVIRNEGQGLCTPDVVLDRGDAQREVKLIGRTRAHARYRNDFAGWADAGHANGRLFRTRGSKAS